MKKQKSFIAQLKEQKQKYPSRFQGLVAVQACKDDIINGLEAKFTLKEIHELLVDQGRMPVSYSGFIKMVRKHIQPTDYPRKMKPKKVGTDPGTIENKNKKKGPKGIEQLDKKNKGPRPDHVYNPDNYDPDELI